MAVTSGGYALDVIGGTEVDSPEMHNTPNLTFLNFHGDPRQQTGLSGRLARLAAFYLCLLRYAATTNAGIFHILWNGKLQYFDRTFLMLYYKLLGKKVVFTAHNVNAGKRDGNDSFLNRLTLKSQYRLSDHIFVHTEKMKSELIQEFGVRDKAITVIPFGLNNSVPDTSLTPDEAKQKLGVAPEDKSVLFFGAIRPYKGLEHLVAAFQLVSRDRADYRLIIAGEPKKDSMQYLEQIQKSIAADSSRDRIIQKLEFIPDEETELYFKAADVVVLPYTLVFQSGVLFLGFSFGLPAIATDVGSFRDDIIAGETGYVSPSVEPQALAATITKYFASPLYSELRERRAKIRDFARSHNSWDVAGAEICKVYDRLLSGN